MLHFGTSFVFIRVHITNDDFNSRISHQTETKALVNLFDQRLEGAWIGGSLRNRKPKTKSAILKINMVGEKVDNLGEPRFRGLSWQGLGLLLVSGASLCFEINLTRIFSVSQFYHFAFMVVSIALLGFGASGTFLTLKKTRDDAFEEKALPWLAGGSGACMLGAYLLVNWLPFDSYSMFINPIQIPILLLHYGALSAPFFFSGMIISLMLRQYRSAEGEVYAVNLVGSAVGCLVAILTPALVGGEGVVALCVVMASVTGLFFIVGRQGRRKDKVGVIGFLSIILIPSLILLGWRLHSGVVPTFFNLKRSPYKSISYALQPPAAKVISTEWNSYSKVDIVESPSLHSVPGLSYRYTQVLPSIRGLFVDGDNMNAILPPDPELDFAAYLPASVAYDLRPGGKVLILEPKGGMDVWVANALGADQITAAEGNPLIIGASSAVYDQGNVSLVRASGRSYLRGSKGRYDIIQLPLTDSYHPVSSGAYALGEDYRYTVEAISDMLDNLKPDGLLVITRWLHEEPSEWLKTFTLVVTALEKRGFEPGRQIIGLRGYNTGTLLVKGMGFTADEMVLVRNFASEKAFDLVFGPGISEVDINRFNILPEPIYFQTFHAFLEADPRNAFYDAYRYNVEPPTDDQPFFGHYFKWSQIGEILATLGVTWQPFGGAGYLVVIVIFLLALLLSGILILLPVILTKRGKPQPQEKRIPLYFGLIGMAFMLVEMPLIQRFILYLDQPAYAFASILFGILLFSGLGSRFGSRKLRLSSALVILISLLALYSFLLPYLLRATLGLHLTYRLIITILLVAPLGFLMGIPFPAGLAWMQGILFDQDGTQGRWMLAWVWAVNGACSVIASILASLLALSYGLRTTSLVGVGFYFLAALIIARKF